MTPVTIASGSDPVLDFLSAFKSNTMAKPTGLPFPNEIIEMIAENLDYGTLKNFRRSCKNAAHGSLPVFAKQVGLNKKVYPTQLSMASWFALISNLHKVVYNIKDLNIVGQTLRVPPQGYDWAWESAKNGYQFDAHDATFIERINASHQEHAADAQKYVTTGQFRKDLTTLLAWLPKVININVQRTLGVGEHIPGWAGARMLPMLSGYHKDFDLSVAFYADWQYDTKKKAVTVWEDEFGEIQCEADAGPQARFIDDLYVALCGVGKEMMRVEGGAVY